MNAYRTSNTERDKLRARGTLFMLGLYWIGVSLVGALLPAGAEHSATLRGMARSIVGPVQGVMQAASRSFDPSFTEVFGAFCLAWSVLIAALSTVVLPAGSHVTFVKWRHKAAALGVTGLMLTVAWLATGATHRPFSATSTSGGALIHIGISGRLGAVVVLGALWGFAQLFFFFAFRTVAAAPVRR